ncbi:NADP-dependent phosphogluconate dehydrogenase [Chelatococcus asaccharovorans]|uniref:NADP-dependent phosphogluconate dehydrogenase n=1 Tax=Chelatococcus asaccharovorans TaxID=28210 RepID=UPI00226500C7|nr:NADP-dependent phosphogluconate dehydrogenase [Chelatococcus asaccharovorans]
MVYRETALHYPGNRPRPRAKQERDMTTKASVGVLGLGTMGANLALNLADQGGQTVALFNRTTIKAQELADANPAFAKSLVPTDSLERFVEALATPRIIILMVQAGAAVDEQIAALKPLLANGDIVIDAGNADFNDTRRRAAQLKDSPIRFVGMGVSGGELGARHGPSIMAGGDADVYAIIGPILERIAAKYQGAPCVAHMGTDGAGHFVKTIHNGIEYADMEMIAEVYGIMRDGLGLKAADAAKVFTRWNAGDLASYLIEISGVTLAETDPDTGKPMVDIIVDEAGQKGTGRWAVIEAQKLAVSATTLEAAVSARIISAHRAERARTGAIYDLGATEKLTGVDLDALEKALETAKIIAYAQGFVIMQEASKTFGWNLPLGKIAEIWRAGCIIRSRFLDAITRAFDASETPENLLQVPEFVKRVKAGQGALRRVVAQAVLAGIPVPALSAALAYFDDLRRPRGTANLIQAQRDLFGAHTFRRLDRDGVFHHEWPPV